MRIDAKIRVSREAPNAQIRVNPDLRRPISGLANGPRETVTGCADAGGLVPDSPKALPRAEATAPALGTATWLKRAALS